MSNRRFNEQHPRCPFCGAWAQWDGVELICNNVRCQRGPAPGSASAKGQKSKICGRCPLHRMPKARPVQPIDGQLTLDLGGDPDE